MVLVGTPGTCSRHEQLQERPFYPFNHHFHSFGDCRSRCQTPRSVDGGLASAQAQRSEERFARQKPFRAVEKPRARKPRQKAGSRSPPNHPASTGPNLAAGLTPLPARRSRRNRRSCRNILTILFLTAQLKPITAIHHMKRDPIVWVNERDSQRPLIVTNNCQDDLWPAITTQAGSGPPETGFYLAPGSQLNQTVSADWNGRVWARTNCSFNSAGTLPASGQPGSACTTGDCGGTLSCLINGQLPATLAEFNLLGYQSTTFYDISLVDGYNVPIAIISLLGTSGNSTETDIPPNLTNPICIATADLLAPKGTNDTNWVNTNSTFPLPVDQSVTYSFVQGWCPWDLQLSPPQRPGDGVYPYPDDNIQRPLFNPCLSACAKWGNPSYCCTGKYNAPGACSPSYYSTQAKAVCPDAYSYAYDDATSTFGLPAGGGFEIVFCPEGRSTTILSTLGALLTEIGADSVPSSVIQQAQNLTLIYSRNDAAPAGGAEPSLVALIIVLVVAFLFV